MGLLAKIFSNASDSEFKLAQDLVAIAIADGEISEAERDMINKICRNEGMEEDVLEECMHGFDGNATCDVFDNRKEKILYLKKLIRVMAVDGESSHMEIYILEIIAARLGLSYMEVLATVLSTATHANFPGDIGGKALNSFIHNVVDPKGKSLVNNRNNIATLFDIMAENTPVYQNREQDKVAFIEAMNHATHLLSENTILMDEFRMTCIDFETVLMDEREQAILRWTER